MRRRGGVQRSRRLFIFRRSNHPMASAAEQMASNISLASFAKATDLKKRLWFTLGALIIFRLLSLRAAAGDRSRARWPRLFETHPRRRARFLQHVLGRQPGADEPDRAGRDALHHRLDRRAAGDLDVADARRAQERGRERPQEDQPIYPLRHRLPLRDPGLFHGRRASKAGARARASRRCSIRA